MARPRALQSLARRRVVRAALALLALFYSAALFAPLLATDLPLFLRARDVGSYRAALGELGGLAAAVERAASERDAPALAAERSALDLRLRRVADGLEAGAARDMALATSAQLRELGALPQAAETQALRSRVEGLLQAGAPAAQGGPALRLRTSFPALAALSGPEWLGLLAWALALAALRSSPRRRRALLRAAGLAGGAAVLLALLGLAGLALGAREAGGTSYKQRLQAGELEVERIVLPLLFYGVAETHTSESFRPPTWLAAAQRDEFGRGPARDSEHELAGLRGLTSPGTPIVVRYGEPARNAALRHIAGTDALGRDLAVRLLWGARVSLVVGLAAAALLTALGLLLGGLAGFLGGATDFVVARLIELVLSFPALFLIVLAAAFSDPDSLPPLLAIVGIIALVSWTGVARLVRAEMLRLRSSAFVLAAQAQGLPRWRVALVHALPNALSPVLVAATFAVGAAILTESVVSYLGFGVRHPWPSWGGLIGESTSAQHWWLQVFPGLLIFASVCAFNLLGEALRDALDPRLEESPR